jgi:two-component system, OmpR family, sensor kinase
MTKAASLRTRLWLSYALVIVAALFLTMLVLLLYLVRSPLAYRTTLVELEAVQNVLQTSQPDLASQSVSDLETTLTKFGQTMGLRLVLLDSHRKVVIDTRLGEEPAIAPRRFQVLRATNSLRDEDGQVWLFSAKWLTDGRILLLLTPRPRLPLLTILRNDLFVPFIYSGLLALVLSLFVALGLARWIGNPLQSLVLATRKMPDASPLAMHGPREIQELSGAFNAMSKRVSSTRQAQREFVANVSHELKTPITSIQGFAQALEDGTADTPEKQKQAVAVIKQESERMHHMVLDLLDLARFDSGSFEISHSPVDIQPLLTSLVGKFSPQAGAAGVSLGVETDPLPAIAGDGDRLAQVFSNLVDNALKFTPAGGRITLRAVPKTSGVLVEVSDTGMGIPDDVRAHIFERFYQADPSRPGGGQHGAGLGLAIVQEIVQAHGGTISVRSTPGEGSTFSVWLPITPPGEPVKASKRRS